MAFVVRNRFYPQIAIALAMLAIVAFSRTYYLRFLTDLPPLVTLVHLHGLVFTAWLALFITQTQFIARERVDLHMKLGVVGAGLAALVVVLGVAAVFHTAGIPRVRPSGLSPAQFTIVPLLSIVLFALFVSLGLAFRHKAGLHKRFMVLGMVAVVGPAVGRLLLFFESAQFAYLVQPAVVVTFVAWCLACDFRKHAVVHPVYAIGGTLLVVSWPVRMAIAHSEWWQPVGEWIGRMGAGL